MYRYTGLKKPADSRATVTEILEGRLRTEVTDIRIVKESIDARDKNNVILVYTVDFNCNGEVRNRNVAEAPEPVSYDILKYHGEKRPVVVGFGPCGMFAALILARSGARPVALERGKKMSERVKDVERFFNDGILDPKSNVSFGEGGAGTFSDGKLTTGIKDKRVKVVIDELINAGAPEEIRYKAKAHIGTDLLRDVVINIRHEIERLGGEVRFESQMTGIFEEDKKFETRISNFI